ncbi:MAG: DUF3943 domain-containing protein [Ignavibacteriaceae bacterium]|nr:DUF3943 domain-containing protein [Ignavibacteriaceae bacterium]
MKTIYVLVLSVLFSTLPQAQFKNTFDNKISPNRNALLSQIISKSADYRYSDSSSNPTNQDSLSKLKKTILDTNKLKNNIYDTNIKSNVVAPDTNSKKILVKDSTAHLYNQYRGLLNDDPIYNAKAPLWQPIFKVALQNTLLNLVDHYVLHYDFSVVGFNSWNRTFLHSGFPWNDGWKWDEDRFGNNFFLHPYTGASYFNIARSSGYDYWESSIFVFGGAYMWKLFGENGGPEGKPEREDLIITTLGGMFGGEVLYRLGSNVIDERTTGTERVGREFLAFLLSPGRTLSRFLSGKLFNHNTEEVYQKEPLDIVLSAGALVVNNEKSFGSGTTGFLLNADFDYGNPFEKRSRKPYDYFQLRTDLNFGQGRKVVDNIIGYGILTGTNTKVGNAEVLAGIFQHFDYWDNKVFELGTMSFGGGAITKFNIVKGTNLYTNLNLALIPFAGNSTEKGPDTTQIRDYNFGGGAQFKCDLTLNVGGIFSLTLLSYYYWIHTYVGYTGENYVGIIKPRIEFHLFNNVGIGFEHRIYYDDRYLRDFAASHQVHTEQKVFLTIYLADFLHNR